MAVLPIIDVAEFETVQTLLKARNPAQTTQHVVSDPTPPYRHPPFVPAASSAKTAGFGVPSSILKWRTRHDSNV